MAGYLAQSALFTTTALAISGYALYDDLTNNKRKFAEITPPPTPGASKKGRQNLRTSRTAMPRMRRSRFGRRRRFGRRNGRTRVKRVLRTARRRRFKRAVTRILTRKLETFKRHYLEEAFTLAPGNGTTGMNVRVFAPWQSAFTQGTTSANIHGSKVHLWKFMWRLNIKGLLAGDVHVQILFIKSDFQMDVTAAATNTDNEGANMTPATDVDSVPTQVPPNSNLPLFDTTATPGQFAGLSPVTKFNNDNISILKIWNFKLHGFGQAGTDPFLDTTLTFPFNKDVQIQETDGTIDGIPRFFGPTGRGRHSDQYYILMRTWGQDFISATDAIDVDHRGLLMWKEI
uniref:Capsid protein n=1 Tax=Genomoviridae sp. TaxID=2202565 RepID=A0A858NF95_9VIRU|nr:MAG: capsid protein [Genomoviridae sp.]